MKIIVIICLLLALLKVMLAAECPPSHFNFVGRYALGKQDELNTTFTKIMEKLSVLPDTSYKYKDNTYTIFNTKLANFYYRDSMQKGDVLGNDTIVIYGGRLEAYLTFQWKKQGISNLNGSGSTFGLSNSIIFVKSVVMAENGSFFSYKLSSYQKVDWSLNKPFELTRIDPPKISDEDREALVSMLNKMPGTTSVCDQLEAQIAKYYGYYLGNSLSDEHIPMDGQFDYIWRPGRGKPNATLPFNRRGIDVRLQSQGVKLLYEVQAVNDSQWKCGSRLIPNSPLNPEVYGASQQFISLDFYENVIRNAISQGILDTDLNRENWESRMFQFYAGDLYEVLGKVQDRYFAAEEVNGNCKASPSNLKISKFGSGTLNISISFDCELNIKRNKVVDFKVGLQLEVQGLPLDNTIDFKLRSHKENVTLYPYSDFQILSQQLGKAMISHSINRLYEGRLFGSGWPLSPPRDYPHFTTEDNFTFVYDSSHIKSSLPDRTEL